MHFDIHQLEIEFDTNPEQGDSIASRTPRVRTQNTVEESSSSMPLPTSSFWVDHRSSSRRSCQRCTERTDALICKSQVTMDEERTMGDVSIDALTIRFSCSSMKRKCSSRGLSPGLPGGNRNGARSSAFDGRLSSSVTDGLCIVMKRCCVDNGVSTTSKSRLGVALNGS